MAGNTQNSNAVHKKSANGSLTAVRAAIYRLNQIWREKERRKKEFPLQFQTFGEPKGDDHSLASNIQPI